MEDGWIEHDGKGMPVDRRTLVYAKFRDGQHDMLEDLPPSFASYWHDDEPENSNWIHDGSNSDIVAYMIWGDA